MVLWLESMYVNFRLTDIYMTQTIQVHKIHLSVNKQFFRESIVPDFYFIIAP